MSTAHRPTWDPAQARDVKGNSRQFSARDMAAHTTLKFRQPGQTSSSEVARRDLKAELMAAEAEARDKKRKALGLPSENVTTSPALQNGENEEANKRRKLVEQAVALDAADAESDEEKNENGDKAADEEEEEDSDDSDEDDTEALMKELEKIKRERAAEKERQERDRNEKDQVARDEEVATANPLLNLAAALGHETAATGTGRGGTFAVKRRWDDDRIFQNQAQLQSDKPSGQFVNDLLRTEFHRKFMAKFIK